MEGDEFIEVTLSARIKPYAEEAETGIDQYDKIEDRLIGVMQESGEVTVEHLEVTIPAALVAS